MNSTKVKSIDDLPELPFEQILNQLSLEDRLKSRAVSRSWRKKFDSYPVESLCYSTCPLGFIEGNGLLVSGAFACNFISSTRFESFFNAFGRSILSNLKHLRLYGLDLNNKVNATLNVTLAPTLNSFGQLEELVLFSFDGSSSNIDLELNLPMLTSLQLESVCAIKKLTLNTPRLKQVQLGYCASLRLAIGDSVERLITQDLAYTAMENLKNLKNLYLGPCSAIDPKLLSGLEQLKEFHLFHSVQAKEIFEQKQRYGHTDLKIYLCGLLLNGPDDPAIDTLFAELNEEAIAILAEHPSRLTKEIPFLNSIPYPAIERIDPEVAIDLLSKFTDLDRITVDRPIQDIERFLDLLKNLSISELEFLFGCDQPQDLLNRLPKYCAVQKLVICDAPSDFDFLFTMNHLISLHVACSIDIVFMRKLLKELPYLSQFKFLYNNKRTGIRIDRKWSRAERFAVLDGLEWRDVPDLEGAIQFIVENTLQERGERKRLAPLITNLN